MNLLIDMGNTRLKWAIAVGGQITVGAPLLNALINRQELIGIWKGICPRRLIVSWVGENRLVELVLSVAFELWLDVDIIRVKPQALGFGVMNAYRQPEQLGVDRWLTLVAVRRYYPGFTCIVDCGTAVTVDLIDADGRHQGGLISPGLTLMKKALGQGTKALHFSETNHVFGLADNTGAAIYSGTLMAVIGLIEHVLAKQPSTLQLILTGGDAELIAGKLDVKATVDSDLVLRGLLCVLEEQA